MILLPPVSTLTDTHFPYPALFRSCCIAFGGRLLVVGFASGRIPEVSVNMPLIKGFSVVGVRACEYGRRFPERGAENVAAIDALAAAGRIRPHVHAALELADRKSTRLNSSH